MLKTVRSAAMMHKRVMPARDRGVISPTPLLSLNHSVCAGAVVKTLGVLRTGRLPATPPRGDSIPRQGNAVSASSGDVA